MLHCSCALLFTAQTHESWLASVFEVVWLMCIRDPCWLLISIVSTKFDFKHSVVAEALVCTSVGYDSRLRGADQVFTAEHKSLPAKAKEAPSYASFHALLKAIFTEGFLESTFQQRRLAGMCCALPLLFPSIAHSYCCSHHDMLIPGAQPLGEKLNKSVKLADVQHWFSKAGCPNNGHQTYGISEDLLAQLRERVGFLWPLQPEKLSERASFICSIDLE